MAEAVLKLGQKGQVIIPAELRRELHWEPGKLLRAVQTGGRVLLEAAMLEDQASGSQAEPGVDNDPIWQFIGSGKSNRTNWSTDHTRKIGQ